LPTVSCQPFADSHEPHNVARYIDLLRRIELEGVPDRKSLGIEVWTLNGDSRAVLYLHSKDSLKLGPFSATGACVFRYGMGMRPRHWGKGDGVEFIVSIEQSEDKQVLSRQPFSPGELDEPSWEDREVAIPYSPGEPFTLELETGPGATGNASFDQAGWSHPHLICEEPEPPVRETSSGDPLSVLLISIDTLRQDHLNLYGYTRPTSPALGRLGQESVVFDNAFAPAPYTLPSHSTLLTGQPPVHHRAGFDFPLAPLSPDVRTLAERFQEAGYRTVALTAGGQVSRQSGLARGFEEWRELQRANLASVLPGVFDLLYEESGRPLFFFLHTYDVHGPYQQPEGFRFFSGDAEGEAPSGMWPRLLATRYHDYQELQRFDRTEDVVAAYDSGIRFVDAQLDRLFGYLRELGVYERRLIVVTSDHGESLFEAGRYFGHSHTLQDRELRVPLLVRAPGHEAERRDELVELEDVAPTLLDLAGIADARDLPGNALLSTENRRDVERDYILGGSSHLGAVYARSRQWKLISPPRDEWKGRLERRFGPLRDHFPLGWQLYNLEVDPGERENLYPPASQNREAIRGLATALRAEEVPGRLTGKSEIELDPESERHLRALGYVQ